MPCTKSSQINPQKIEISVRKEIFLNLYGGTTSRHNPPPPGASEAQFVRNTVNTEFVLGVLECGAVTWVARCVCATRIPQIPSTCRENFAEESQSKGSGCPLHGVDPGDLRSFHSQLPSLRRKKYSVSFCHFQILQGSRTCDPVLDPLLSTSTDSDLSIQI